MPRDDRPPLDNEEHERQLAWLRSSVRDLAPRAYILDLFCGSGRIGAPLARDGHSVVGVDRDADACAEAERAGVRTIRCDALDDAFGVSGEGAPFDAALILGNSMMLVADADAAVSLFRRLRAGVRAGGLLIIDDVCTPFWREVAEGNWQTGISEDGSQQLVWGESDALFVLREGTDVDTSSWSVTDRDTPLRLWSLGALRLLALATGWDGPTRVADGHAITFIRPADPA